MAEILLNKLLNNAIDRSDFFEWLFKLNYEDEKFADLSTQFGCSRPDFVTFFLNFVHEDVASCSDRRVEVVEEPKTVKRAQLEINKSHSFPLDLSAELDDSVTSTPKITKVNSECSVLSYMSPVSPIYRSANSFTTPKSHRLAPQKSPICLGDFIVTKRVLSKKKGRSSEGSETTKRRIKPTNLSQQTLSSFHRSENSFNFDKNDPDELPNERNGLTAERLKILSRSDLHSVTRSPKKTPKVYSDGQEIDTTIELVSYKPQIDQIISIYVELLDNNFILNLTSEIYFLISLLSKKQFYSPDWGIEILSDQITASQLFVSVHNVVYFASKCLESQVRILRNYDKSTIRLLSENSCLNEFVPGLVEQLHKIQKADRIVEVEVLRDNVCFNSDTDNRQNFPNDPSFHAFRKQRDLFYEILRLWEQHRLSPGFNYTMSLGGKIRTLLSLYNEPTNFIHFSRLFKAQLLSTCLNSDGETESFFACLEVDAQKLSKLRSRCVTKETCQGLNSLPKFSESEDFYKDFIVVAANHCFNRHLANALIEEIVELNETNFSSNEIDDKENDVDATTKKSYYLCIKSLRLLAKFLGFIESLPYKTECNNYSEHLLNNHLKMRQQICPNFDVKSILQKSIGCKSVILCVPWLVKYLSMLDHVTLRLPYYTAVRKDLFWLYRNFQWGPDCNVFLVKFCLGWFFELPHIPDDNYLHYCASVSPHCLDESPKIALDKLEIVDQDILYFCCPYLDEIKKLLASTSTANIVTIKHITPITASQSPDALARKKLEQQLEEAFFNGQPVSLRKTVEFVSERVASTCVKYVCSTIVPNHKKSALDRLKNSIDWNEDEEVNTQKIAMKTKANQLAAICLRELEEACEAEIEAISSQKIAKAIDSLVSLDILPQTKEVTVAIAKKTCVERVKQWVNSHVTLGLFSKDFNDEIQRVANFEVKRAKKPIFMLPPGGNKSDHNEGATSAAHLLEKYRELCIVVIEQKQFTANNLIDLLDETTKSIDQRGDFNQCILATICTVLLDLALLLLAYDPKIMSLEPVMSKSCDIWRLYYNGCDDLFKSLLAPRNVMVFAQSSDVKATWCAFARFCARLVKNDMLSCDNFESQCAGIFKTEWDQGSLKRITDFFKTFIGLYREQGGSANNFTFLLDFLSDYCEEL